MLAKITFRLVKCTCFFLLLDSCGTEQTDNSPQKEIYSDSIGFLLLKENAENNDIYENNLQKALSEIEQTTSDSLKAQYASILSLKFLVLKDSNNFKRANKLAMYWSKKIKDSAKVAAAHWDAGDFYRNLNVIDSAYYHYTKAHEIFKASGNDYDEGRMLYNMSLALSTIKDYTAAETYAIEAIKIFKPLKKNLRLFDCYNQLGIVTNNLKEYQKALEYHKKALEYLRMENIEGIEEKRSQNNIGSVYLSQKKYALAVEQFMDVINTDSLYLKDPKLYAKALGNYAYSQFKLDDTVNVRNKLKKAIKIKDSIGDTPSLSGSYYNLAEVLLESNDTVGALAFAQKAKKSSRASDNNRRVLETLGLLTKISPEKATAYAQEYIMLNDSLQITERRARNKFERIRFETDETLAENELLERQKQLWTGIAATLLLLALSSFIIIAQRRKNEKLRFEEEQQASNQKIFNMLLSEKSKIEEGKKLAQKRISEELHDSVQGRIQGIRMILLGLNKRDTPEAISQRSEAIRELKDVQEEVRVISHELSHSAYQKIYGFMTTVNELLNDLEKNAGIHSTFCYDKDWDWDSLDGNIKINVYRIIQESIQNCIKHAKAKKIVLAFTILPDNVLKVVLDDDGKGYNVKKGKGGIGMRNINSRIEKLEGTWRIDSTIDKGTTVTLHIPLTSKEQITNAPRNPIAVI